jgi:putative transcriptional regulator
MLGLVETLAPGFLIAMPQLGDPNFHRSVVLVIEHNGHGAMGLVLNRTSNLSLRELASAQSLAVTSLRTQDPVFMGGPVEPQRGFVLHDSPQALEKHEVVPGLFLSVTVDALERLLLDPGCRLRLCLGYAGWGPKQLDRELAQGSWLFTEAAAETVLGQAPGEIWDSLLRAMGVDPAMLQVGRGVN